MASELARIFGTEDDKVNCSFYLKIGTCRHGRQCTKQHLKPKFSRTILLPHLYIPPSKDSNIDAREHYKDFYEDILEESLKFGSVEAVLVCDNIGDHMIGNVYVKFSEEEYAAEALNGLEGRFYAGRIVYPEYSPVTDFREGRCRQFEEQACSRGGYCNFLHFKPTPRFARRFLKTGDRAGGGSWRASSSRHRRRGRSRSEYKIFPIRGTSSERRACIAQWNRERTRHLKEIDRTVRRREDRTPGSAGPQRKIKSYRLSLSR